MRLLDRAMELFAPVTAMRRRRARVLLEETRAYEGASRKDGWRPRRAGASANADHMADAKELRIRARSLVQNVPYCNRGLNVLVSAAIGTGITPKSTSDKLDKLWERWCEVADADAQFDLYGLQAAAYRAMEQDGEVLIRRRIRRAADGLPVPLQLQVLEIDWLDGNKNAALRDGGRIINGIEYDVLGKPRAYWLFGAHPGDVLTTARLTSAAVPAADILHLFSPQRPGQGRGVLQQVCWQAQEPGQQLLLAWPRAGCRPWPLAALAPWLQPGLRRRPRRRQTCLCRATGPAAPRTRAR